MQKSAQGCYWHTRAYDEDFIKILMHHCGISEILARLLSVKVASLEQAEHFLLPKLKNQLPDPFHLKDMQKAVERLYQAIIEQEVICVFADYDVDGATSAALLKNILEPLGAKIFIYVPDRLQEGYGPSAAAMHTVKAQGAQLLITVDCGSVAFEALEEADKLGIDAIIIDHHISLDYLPKAVAVINPNRIDEVSEYKYLAAVGVSFLFLVALCRYLKERQFFQEQQQLPDLLQQLDIVALGTVCDVMPLTDLNRAIVAQGLKIAQQRQNVGYRTLCDVARIDEPLNCYHLGFIIGPRINAGGRVGQSELGAKLLSTNNLSQAEAIATKLDMYNRQRQQIEQTILAEAMQIAEQQQEQALLFVVGEGWHPGVIGIVAGRLKEKYNKPVAVVAVDEDGVAKASCRSVGGVDFGCMLLKAKQEGLLINGGGHAMAAGFTAQQTKLPQLLQSLLQQCEKLLAVSRKHLERYYDLQLTSNAITRELIAEINRLEPFGQGNPAPIIKLANMFVLKADIVGEKHIKLLLAPTKFTIASKALHAIVFNAIGNVAMEDLLFSNYAKTLTIFGRVQINRWQEQERIQLVVLDALADKN